MRESSPTRLLETAPAKCRTAAQRTLAAASPCRSIFCPAPARCHLPKLLKINGLVETDEKMQGAQALDSEANSLFHNILAVSPFDARICLYLARSGNDKRQRMSNLQKSRQKNKAGQGIALGAADPAFTTDLYFLGSFERTAKYCAVCSFAAEASPREVSRRRPFPNTGGHTSERKQRVP